MLEVFAREHAVDWLGSRQITGVIILNVLSHFPIVYLNACAALAKVTLPLIAPNLIAGGLLAFSFAMLEVSDSMILAQQAQHFPITKAIYSLVSVLGTGRSSPSCSWEQA